MTNRKHISKDILLGVAVGDALGVPYEFKTRESIRKNPATNMVGYGTYHLPEGTWSDDSSMTFCLAESLIKGFDLRTIAQHFVDWARHNYWTPHGHVFDIGIATKQAIGRIAMGENPETAGGSGMYDNGNGSLMRILPLLLYIKDMPIQKRFEITKQVSSITHAHIRSVVACFYYLEFALGIMESTNKFDVYSKLQNELGNLLASLQIPPSEITLFDRLLKQNIHELDETQIQSSGYVIHTLEASMWCLLSTDSYEDAVLKAVNLGEDTDTTGAVTGGLAALLYGHHTIPSHWIQQIARHDDIHHLAERLENKFATG